MTAEMAAQMEGESAAQELAETCLAEFDRWKDHAINQGVQLGRDRREAANHAVRDLRADLLDYLPHALATALTALRLQGAFDNEENDR